MTLGCKLFSVFDSPSSTPFPSGSSGSMPESTRRTRERNRKRLVPLKASNARSVAMAGPRVDVRVYFHTTVYFSRETQVALEGHRPSHCAQRDG
ncbi:hypothetical protein HaLaN_29061 [Haematococcus lacustris]|uniref:Uncharacterized protein n=1 Tax=Haematococcus lacustris TaxID=44745 RepID=A0A6A0ABY8_HAELA|nr:hypothetical protein HaLaN_29061 [Haematococcus lacustris]